MSEPPSLIDSTPMAAVPLISFRPSPDIQRAIDDRGLNWHIHPIEFAGGPVNLDNYRVKILKQPSEKGLDSLEGLLKYIRLKLNDFLPQDKVRFGAYHVSDAAKWWSDHPLGAVMRFDFGNFPINAHFRKDDAFNLEDGSVVCSSYSPTHWIFSTIWTGGDFNHPVSGNRQFGCYKLSGPSMSEGGAYIYTRAADRITDNIINAFFMSKIFNGGHETWVHFQYRVVEFVKRKGGVALVMPPYSARHDWARMRERHKPTVEWVVQSRHYMGPQKRKERDWLSTRGGPI